MHAEPRIIVMAKAPIAGRVKTRLTPPLSATQAASIHARMLEIVLARAQRLCRHVWLAVDQPAHPMFRARAPWHVCAQGAGDLGARMARLLSKSIAHDARPVLFLGADSPHMPDQRLLAAMNALAGHDVVLGPVEDGGYDLIGMTAPHAQLFQHIDWGSPRVFRQTCARCAQLGLRWHALDVFFDVDTVADLRRALVLQPDAQLLALLRTQHSEIGAAETVRAGQTQSSD